MPGPDSIREQIRREELAKKKLESEKETSEKKRKRGEEVLSDLEKEKQRVTSGLASFERGVVKSVYGTPPGFEKYYKKKIANAINGSGIRQINDNFTNVASSVKKSVLNLDDVIAGFARSISQKNTLIRDLKKMLQAAVDALKSIIPGGN